jgi:hypothetical protein
VSYCKAATALTMRSPPTSRGLSVSILRRPATKSLLTTVAAIP